MDVVAYIQAVRNLSETDIVDEYAKHNYAMAKIADKKFKELNKALGHLKILIVLSAFYILYAGVLKIL